MPASVAESNRLAELGNGIRDVSTRRFFGRFVRSLVHVHEAIELQTSRVEVRFFYDGAFICRLVPYRELFHVQIGEDPAWETRVRSEKSYIDAFDRTLEYFLRMYAGASRSL